MVDEKFITSVYKYRKVGKIYCETEGSDHYKNGFLEPAEIMIANGLFEDFAISNIIKYALRFKNSHNLNDLKKIADYAHILCGIELEKQTLDELNEQIIDDNGESKTFGEKLIEIFKESLDKVCKNIKQNLNNLNIGGDEK